MVSNLLGIFFSFTRSLINLRILYSACDHEDFLPFFVLKLDSFTFNIPASDLLELLFAWGSRNGVRCLIALVLLLAGSVLHEIA